MKKNFQIELLSRVREVIEHERAILMRAESVLRCASIAIEYGDEASPRRPHYPDVLDEVSSSLRAVINNLDSPKLEQRIVGKLVIGGEGGIRTLVPLKDSWLPTRRD